MIYHLYSNGEDMTFSQICSMASYAALDFETAGAAPGETDVPVQIGIACFRLGETPELWASYIASSRPVKWNAAKIHGITDETIRFAPSYNSLWPTIKNRLGSHIIVGHNLGTEKRLLRAFPGHGFGPWLDTLTLSRNCYPGLDNYSLENICDTLRLTEKVSELIPGKKWHDALYDATASAVLLQHIVSSLELHDAPLFMLGSALQ